MATAEELANTLNSWRNESRLLLWNLEDDIDTRILSQFDKLAHGGMGFVVESLRSVMYELIEAVQWVVYGYSSSFNYSKHKNLHDALIALSGPPDWLDIIEAYINAHDDHRSAWQLLTDAYKASMYDKPFDLEYHTMWVQRFKSWR